MAAMGIFDVAGLTDADAKMGLSTPLFDEIKIQLNPKYYSGKDFVIKKETSGLGGAYIEQIDLNGKIVHEPFIPLKSIRAGGILKLKTGNRPKDKY